MYQFEKNHWNYHRVGKSQIHFKNLEKIYNYGGESKSYLTINKILYLSFFNRKPKRNKNV